MRAPIKVISIAAALAIPGIMASEGLRTTPYVDEIGRGKPLTVCYGITGKDVENRQYTEYECLLALGEKLSAEYEPPLKKCFKDWDGLPVSLQSAMLDTAWNLGTSKTCKSSMRKLADQRKYYEACQFLNKYIYSGGKVYKGLVKRRAHVSRLCIEGLPRGNTESV